MAAATGLTSVKRFSYRGVQEEFSNTYWLSGGPPADQAAWLTLWNALVAEEKKVLGPVASIIRGYGYDDDTGHKPDDEGTVAPAVFSVDLTVAPAAVVPGTMDVAAGSPMPGDSALWVRWKTARRTSPGGKPIYIRKYFHPGYSPGANNPDTILATVKTAMLAFGAKLGDGTFAGTRRITTCGQSDTILNWGVSAYVTTRTLKRRGKRNP